MPEICPTVTAFDLHEYRLQMERLATFAGSVHIDLMDGELAPTQSPGLSRIWWPHELTADIHLMFKRPMEQLDALIHLQPRMVIIHAEAEVDHMHFAAELHRAGIETGLALLQETPVASVERIINSFDQILIFSGNLGHHGGQADLQLLDKVKDVKKHHPDAQLAWDGGISADNARQLVDAGVDVLNVGGFIQGADDPAAAYQQLQGLLA